MSLINLIKNGEAIYVSDEIDEVVSLFYRSIE